jgi:hypothetical protein
LSADQGAAHQLLTELRTRISVQPLPYQHGVELRALESLREIFDHARAAMKSNPGCAQFAALATNMLNTTLRPTTARWHRAATDGRLASKDGADEFRADLARVRTELVGFADQLHQMAYGTPRRDLETPPALDPTELKSCMDALEFGILKMRAVDEKAEKTLNESIDGINDAEAIAVSLRRENRKITTAAKTNAVGLALSGGGIRSATFCLGAVQVLADKKLLEHVDFLSTVSGGGYTGSFLSSKLVDQNPCQQVVGGHEGPDPPAIAKLRANSKYLTSANPWASWSRVSATISGMLLNWTAPFLVILVAALLVSFTTSASLVMALGGLTTALVSVALASLFICAVSMRIGPRARAMGGALFAVTSALAIADLIILAIRWTGLLDAHWKVSGAVGALVTAGPTVIRFLPIPKRITRLVLLKALLVAAAIVVPYLAVLAFYKAWSLGSLNSVFVPFLGLHTGFAYLIALTVVVAVVAIGVLDVNMTSLHRLYRDALAKTFVHPPEQKLGEINKDSWAPYHLLNATVNLPSSARVELRDRRGDFFLFSKAWCGSVTTGYYKTERWKAGGSAVDLKTAMAISGAAASPHMGLASIPELSALMTFLNVRLGFWMKNPGRWSAFKIPGFSALLREMFGYGMSERRAWLNLSDGGHIENTGVYELLRRRCKFVIAIDGEADGDYTFGGLLTLVRHAQIDFGIRIEPHLDDLRPDPKTSYSARHAILCRIHYPDAATVGLLLYLKLSVTGNETALVQGYRKKHPEFPHQSTLDQFFDQEQFEAYRELGAHVANGLFSSTLIGQGTKGDELGSVAAWFELLAANLLDPREPGR